MKISSVNSSSTNSIIQPLLLASLLMGASCSMNHTDPGRYDLILRNATIIDGTGAPRFRGDVAVKGDTIALVARSITADAHEVVDANGLVLSPGFVDLLGHSERAVFEKPTLESKVRQGVTTELTGEGTTAAPINDAIADERAAVAPHGGRDNWRTLDDFMQAIERNGSAINFALLVTSSNVRLMTIGRANRAATPEELHQMEGLVDQAMRQGAFGLSTALIYVPAVFSTTEEVIALSKVASRHGGVYFTHMRNEADRIDAAIDETIRIGREADIPVNIWHLKLGGKQNWLRMPLVIARLEAARASGVDIAANVYPYIASKTELTALAPEWALEGGYGEFLKRLDDPETHRRIASEIEHSSFYGRVGGGEGVLITDLPAASMQKYQKLRLSEVAREMGVSPVEAVIELFRSSKTSGGAMYFTMNEEDVKSALASPLVSVGADSGAFVGDSRTEGAHPRTYGTFPRVIGHYVRDEKLFTLEEAVRKITSQAAARAGIWDRGIIRPGMKADLVLFDPDKVADVATYEDPHHQSVGIRDVFVNGVAILRDGRITGALPGRMLRHRSSAH